MDAYDKNNLSSSSLWNNYESILFLAALPNFAGKNEPCLNPLVPENLLLVHI